MKYLVLGASGMAGHVIAIYLQEKGHEVIGLSRKKIDFCSNINLDVTDFESLRRYIDEENFDVIVNAIGILNQSAEEKIDMAIIINSYLPHFLESITKNTKTKIVQLSTDCVFSGETGNYKENDFKDGKSFYDRTKALGEIVNSKDLTFRNSIIGPDINENGIGLFNWFMTQKNTINGFAKVFWSGVTTIELAKAIEASVEQNLTGVYHLVNNENIAKSDLLALFNKYFRNGELEIKELQEPKIDKSLINTRKEFVFEVNSYDKMVSEMKIWVDKHKLLYQYEGW
ncbi:MAG: SDR family oxidoreductase [Candidatus Izemoplasmatales bacterium]|jgi:dTDP-4-dehydrorhamnose reductase